MGQTYSRKATFTKKTEGKETFYTPVNKRAHTVAKKAGKRSKVTLKNLQALKNSGSYTYWQYTDDGTLKRIRVVAAK